MAVGRSLHVGLNSVDPDKYGGWSGDLAACEFDADDMKTICGKQKLKTSMLLTAEATSDAVLAAIGEAAEALGDGDLFVLTYAGHGAQLADTDGDEPDKLDETWVLYDRQVLDDELNAAWAKFAAGVRIVVLSDSCHSGSVVAVQLDQAGSGPQADALQAMYAHGRFMPDDVARRDAAARKPLYDKVRADTPAEHEVALAARVLLLSGCQDNQTSSDGQDNGLFTGTLLSVWKEGAFRGGYRRMLTSVKAKMPPWQSPNYLALNDAANAFRAERPFKV